MITSNTSDMENIKLITVMCICPTYIKYLGTKLTVLHLIMHTLPFLTV